MTIDNADSVDAQQTLQAVLKLNHLSLMPCTAARLLSRIRHAEITPEELTQIIETDPVLFTASVQAAGNGQIISADRKLFAKALVQHLPLSQFRKLLFDLNHYLPTNNAGDKMRVRKDLILHAVATACAAEQISLGCSFAVDPQMLYQAGLLHNIGNLALHEVIPRSFSTLFQKAKDTQTPLAEIQQKHLGIDYTRLGKALLQKWRFPAALCELLWLQRIDAQRIAKSHTKNNIAILQLAKVLAESAGIGQSGNFCKSDPDIYLASLPDLDKEQIDEIRETLCDRVIEKTKLLGFDLPDPVQAFYQAAYETADLLITENEQFEKQQEILSTLEHTERFISATLEQLAGNHSYRRKIEIIAGQWQHTFHTAHLCLSILDPYRQQIPTVVIGHAPPQWLELIGDDNYPGMFLIPDTAFELQPLGEPVDKLIEQIDISLDARHTYMAPLIYHQTHLGWIVFELHQPVTRSILSQKMRMPALFTAALIHQFTAQDHDLKLAEDFAMSLSQRSPIPPHAASFGTIEALAEMAGGAAHELNNPLSVIAGRAQQLYEHQDDDQQKELLDTIRRNANELSSMIDGLMNFAHPDPPHPKHHPVTDLINDAIQLAAQKTGIETINTQLHIPPQCSPVYVEANQIISAMANIITNSLESYTDHLGPVKIHVESNAANETVSIQIMDLGCGMDEQTAQKAVFPFFSSKPAGRQHGMGLAYANRYIDINNGSLDIQSQIDKGTTVTLRLPTSGQTA